jgi:DNA-binding transcriptional ArsR family regulator
MQFDHARGFTPLRHYLYPHRCLRARTATELDFWDILLARADPQAGLSGLQIHRDITASRILSRPTFYKLMRQAEADGLIRRWPGDAFSGGSGRGEYIVEMAPWPPTQAFYKPLAYVRGKWLKVVRGLAAKQVLNLFHLILTRDALFSADDSPVLFISDLRRVSREALGQSLSHRVLRTALASLTELGLVTAQESDGLRRYALNTKAFDTRAPDRKEIAAEIARLLGLKPEGDAPWIRLLADFVEIGGHRLREVPAIYRRLLSLHPLISTERDLETLRANLRQRAPWRSTNYRVVLDDFVRERRAVRQVQQVRSQRVRLRFGTHSVVGETLDWERERWQGVVSALLRYEVRQARPAHPDAGEGDEVLPWLFLWRQGSMIPLETPPTGSGPSARRLRRLDLTRWLRGLTPEEPVSLVAALPRPATGVCIQAMVSLGVRT